MKKLVLFFVIAISAIACRSPYTDMVTEGGQIISVRTGSYTKYIHPGDSVVVCNMFHELSTRNVYWVVGLNHSEVPPAHYSNKTRVLDNGDTVPYTVYFDYTKAMVLKER